MSLSIGEDVLITGTSSFYPEKYNGKLPGRNIHFTVTDTPTWELANPPNVVNIFSVRQRRHSDKKPRSVDDTAANFEAIMERNRRNQERVAAERANKNKGVVRSHRLKK